MDFYSGLTLTAMGIPTSMFTVLFAIGRSAGWIAQWQESVEEAGRRISRPRQCYIGNTPFSYTYNHCSHIDATIMTVMMIVIDRQDSPLPLSSICSSNSYIPLTHH